MDENITRSVDALFRSLQDYAVIDLKRMLDSADYESKYGRLAIPIALTTFSILDIIGSLIKERNSIKKNGDKGIKENLTSAFTYFYSDTIKIKNFGMVINLYRHGMSHLFFPKGVGIHNTNKVSNIITSDGEIYNFNVNPFANKLIKKLDDYDKIIKDNWENIVLNYPIYEERINKDFLDHIRDLPKSPSKVIITSNTTLQYPP
jgi:hypothetical protein